MGVKYFQSFISEHNADRKLLFPINIIDLIKKQKNGSKTIILDVKGCITHLYNRSGLVYGGQLKELEENLIKFVTNITSAGGNIVAFYDGMHEPNKHATWVERRTVAAQNIQQFYAKICNGEKIDDSDITLITAAEEVTVQCTLQSLPNCQLKYSVKECDQDIMEYMRDNDCLALISNDTDYLIFDVPDIQYLSSKHLNLTEMTTMAYDRKAVRDSLGLLQSQMPLFACLSGNDFITSKQLANFHRNVFNISNQYIQFTKLFLEVAEFVQTYSHTPLHLIAAQAGIPEDLLSDTIDFYRCQKKELVVRPRNRNMKVTLEVAREKHQKGELPPEVYELLLKQEYKPRVCVEDLTQNSVELWSQPLRRTLYNIMFFGISGKRPVREFVITAEEVYSVEASRSKFRKNFNSQILERLWRSDTSTKWLTFCFCINRNLDFGLVLKVREHLQVPAVALFYIHVRREKRLMTFDEILIMAFHVVQVKRPSLRDTAVPDSPFKKRAVELAAKFNHVCSLIYLINGTCGFCIPPAQCSPANYFDGKLFAETYTKSRSLEFKMNSAEEADDFRAIMSLLSMEKIHLLITYE